MRSNDLNQAVLADSAAIRQRFASATPFRHVVIDELLGEDLLRALIAEFPAFEKQYAVNEFGETGGKAVRPELPRLGPAFARFDELMSSGELLAWISQATSIDRLLYDPEYLGGGTHENINGQGLDPHVDFNFHSNGHWHRRLNLILFLNEQWEETWGGCLELHKDPWAEPDLDERVMIVPRANRAVIFETTENSWHGFRKIQLPDGEANTTRRSVAVYFYTEKRDPSQTVPGHGTYYVPRPFPEDIAAGKPLSADQLTELKALYEQRNQQIRHLWESERELKEHLSRIHNSPTVQLAQALTWPVRKLRGLFWRH